MQVSTCCIMLILPSQGSSEDAQMPQTGMPKSVSSDMLEEKLLVGAFVGFRCLGLHIG